MWLVLVPWTTLWERNWFARWLPALGTAMASTFVRGAVTGIGLVTIAAGVRELFGVFGGPAAPAASSDDNASGAPRPSGPSAAR